MTRWERTPPGRGRGTFPTWLVVVAVVVPVAAVAVGFLLAPPTTATNSRAFLGTLARFQGGVLAIVFSVTVLGIQLISRLYSPRMLTLFVRAPVFVATFLGFLFSRPGLRRGAVPRRGTRRRRCRRALHVHPDRPRTLHAGGARRRVRRRPHPSTYRRGVERARTDPTEGDDEWWATGFARVRRDGSASVDELGRRARSV